MDNRTPRVLQDPANLSNPMNLPSASICGFVVAGFKQSWLMKLFTACLLVCVADLCSAQTNTNRVYTSDWSEVTNGLRARLEISDSGRVDGKIHYSVVYLELENRSDVLNPMEIYFDDANGLKSQLTDDSGAPPPPIGEVVSEFVPGPYWISLPLGATLKFPISAEGHTLMPQTEGMAVVLHGGGNGNGGVAAAWVVPDQATEDYYLSASLSVPPPTNSFAKWSFTPPDPPRLHPWQGVLQLPKVKIPRKATSQPAR